MKKLLHLDTREWVANGNLPILLKTLPERHYVRNLIIHMKLTGTRGEAEEVDSDLFGLAINLARISKYVNISGMDLFRMYTHAFGKRPEYRADIAGAGTTFTAEFDVIIPFADPRMTDPDDSAMPSELLRSFSLELVTAAANIYGGNFVITAGQIRVHAEVVATNSVRVPTVRQLGFFDPGGQTLPLDPGSYLDLFLTKVSGAAFTAAELTNLDCLMAGESAVQNLTPAQAVSYWNAIVAQDEGVPITWPGPVCTILNTSRVDNKVTKAPGIEAQGGQVQILGTLTEPHAVYWRAMYKTPEDVAAIGRAQGLRDPDQVDYETRAKGGLLESEPDSPTMAKKVGLLPGKFVPPATIQRRAIQAATQAEAGKVLATTISRKSPVGRKSMRDRGLFGSVQ
jgi:hypothetical protein